ncbi:unnamed protein product [Closterium sp. NIES-53]
MLHATPSCCDPYTPSKNIPESLLTILQITIVSPHNVQPLLSRARPARPLPLYTPPLLSPPLPSPLLTSISATPFEFLPAPSSLSLPPRLSPCLWGQTKSRYYKGIVGTLSTIVRDEGLLGLYKGMGATLLGVGPNLAINFCVYETVKANWVRRHPEMPVPLVSLGCGSLAGICSSSGPLLLASPLRLLSPSPSLYLFCSPNLCPITLSLPFISSPFSLSLSPLPLLTSPPPHPPLIPKRCSHVSAGPGAAAHAAGGSRGPAALTAAHHPADAGARRAHRGVAGTIPWHRARVC